MELSELTERMGCLPEELKTQLCKWQEKSMKTSPPPRPSTNDKEVKYKLKSEMVTDVFARVMRENDKISRPPPGKWRKILEKPVFKHDMTEHEFLKQYRRLVTYRRQKRGERIACTLRRLKKQQRNRNVIPSRYLQFPMSLESESQSNASGLVFKHSESKHKLLSEKRKKKKLNKVTSSEELKNKERNMHRNKYTTEYIRAASNPQLPVFKDKNKIKVRSKKLEENEKKSHMAVNKAEILKEVENKTSVQDFPASSEDDKQFKKAHSKTLPNPQWPKYLSKRKPVQKTSPVGLLLQIASYPESIKPLMISKTLQMNAETTPLTMIKDKAGDQSDVFKTLHVATGHKRLRSIHSIKKLNVIKELRQKKHQMKLIYPSSITVMPRKNERHTKEAHTQPDLLTHFYSFIRDFHNRLEERQRVQKHFPKELLTRTRFHSPIPHAFVSKNLDSKDKNLIWGPHSCNNESIILPPINVTKNITSLHTSTVGEQRKFYKHNIFPGDNICRHKWQKKSLHTGRGTRLTSCLSVSGIGDVTQIEKYKSNKNVK